MPHPDDCLCGRSQLFTFAPDTPKPEFWFGDSVSFCWNDEHTEEPFSETGEIIGVAWNPREKFWEYAVVWLASTAYPDFHYPIFDANFITAGELCKTP